MILKTVHALIYRPFFLSLVLQQCDSSKKWEQETYLGMIPASELDSSQFSVSLEPSWLPIMVYDFPDPVCPYAKMHALYLQQWL